MTTTRPAGAEPIREILIRTDRNGRQRAMFLSRRAQRMLPLRLAEAELLIASGQATRSYTHPFTGEDVR